MGETYSHPEHGEMEWADSYAGWGKEVEGWRCKRCHIIAEAERADEVFDEYDCEQYEQVRKGVTNSL